MTPEDVANLITEDGKLDKCPACGSEFATVVDREVSCPDPRCKHYNEDYFYILPSMASVYNQPSQKNRAEKANDRASRWHQGSGTHTSSCSSLVEYHEEMAEKTGDPRHWIAASLWADAAEAEAASLELTQGEWVDYDNWVATPSGQKTLKAEEVSRMLGIEPHDYYG